MKKAELPKLNLGGDLKSLEEQAMAGFKSDEALYHIIHDELELSTAEVKYYMPMIIDLQEDLKICSHCPGWKNCPKGLPCFWLRLKYVNGELVRSYEPCEKKSKRDEMARRFFIRDFPEEWLDKTLQDVDWTNERQKIILPLRKMLKGEGVRWLYLEGGHKQGKSYLLALASKEYGAAFPRVAFANTNKLIENLKEKAIKEKTKFERNMALLAKCPLLVLDEFGNEFKSEFVFSTILYPLLSERAKNGLPTWFTSDFSLKEVMDMYSPKIGAARAKQFKNLLEVNCQEEIKLEGVAVY